MTKRSSACLYVCVCGVTVCVRLFREIEGRTQEEHDNLGQCSLHQSLPQRHWQATQLQLCVKIRFILTSTQRVCTITTPIVVWRFTCHKNRLVEWVLVCERGLVEVGGWELCDRKWGTLEGRGNLWEWSSFSPLSCFLFCLSTLGHLLTSSACLRSLPKCVCAVCVCVL